MFDVQTLLQSNRWLPGFLRTLMELFPEIKQIYLFGSRMRGDGRPDSDWDILIYTGYDQAMSLMRGIARAQASPDLATGGQLIDLYVETEGPTLIAVWSAEVPRVLPNEIRNWHEGQDYTLLIGDPAATQLGARARWGKEFP